MTQRLRDRRDQTGVDYWPDLETLAKVDVGEPRELALRYCIICLWSLVAYFATGAPHILLWLAVYLTVSTVYSVLLIRAKAPIYRRRYLLFLAMNFTSSGLYIMLPLGLWATGQSALQAMGLCGLLGMAIFSLSRHNNHGPVAYWDMFLTIASSLFIGWFVASVQEDAISRLVVGTGCVTIGLYYVVSQYTSIQRQEEMAINRAKAFEAQKMESIGRLTGGVAHDFNNILTVIKGNLELVELVEDPKERDKLIAEAHSASARAVGVIRQLLDFSRQSQLSPQQVDVETLFGEIAPLIRSIVPARIALQIEADDNLPPILIDANKLSSAVLNLAMNAIDAVSGPGEVLINASAVSCVSGRGDLQLPDGKYLQISVTDTGSGIAPEHIDRIQEPFFTTKPVGKGSGLGLSMVSGFADQSGGAVNIQSVPGRGTDVSIFLPVAEGEDVVSLAEKD